MLKHFINIIYVGVITILMVACAEPYDNELSEEPAEIVEDIEEPAEIVEDIEEPVEIIEDIEELTGIIEESIEIVEDIDAADKLNAIIDDFIYWHLDEYLTDISVKDITYLPWQAPEYANVIVNGMPNFCKAIPTVMEYSGPKYLDVFCTLPNEIQDKLDNTLDSLYYDDSIKYCDGDCKPRNVIEFITITALMQKLNLLPSDCDIWDDISIYCGHTDDNALFCAYSWYSFTVASPRSINDIKPFCGAYDQVIDDRAFFTSYSGIWIRKY